MILCIKGPYLGYQSLGLLRHQVVCSHDIARLKTGISSASALKMHRKTSDMICTLVGNEIVEHSDVVGASPIDTALTTSSFST